MKDYIFSTYLCGLRFTYLGFPSNLACLRLNFPLITARIEKHTIIKILIFLQITLENEETVGENEERKRKTRVFILFMFQFTCLHIDNI